MNKFEHQLETAFFSARWLLAPFFLGLMIAIIALLIKFFKTLYILLDNLFSSAPQDSIVTILTLVDSALLASLLLIIAFSGYENFVSKFDLNNEKDRPAWMGKVGFSDLKIKLIGAIVAISAVELLKAFINMEQTGTELLSWKIAIHLTFVFSGVLFAFTEYLNAASKSKSL